MKPARLGCWLGVALATAACGAVPRASAAPPPCIKRVRAADSLTARMMEDGSRRSMTFRRLVEDLERSDVIVYVATSSHLPATDLGATQFVCARGRHRYLRVSVRPRLGPREFAATVAHELQHALEIARDRGVTDGPTMAALYERIGRGSPGGYESEAAVRISHLVCGEIDAFEPSSPGRR